MLTLSVKSNIDEVRAKYRFAGRQVHDAARRALNRTAQQVNTVSVKQLAVETGLNQSVVRRRLYIERASYSTLRAIVNVRPKTYNVASFAGTRQIKKGKVLAQTIFTQAGRRRVVTERGRGGVTSRAWGKRKLYPGAFLIQGGKTAMVRVGKSRLPIRPLYGPRIHGEFVRNVVNSAMVATTRERFPVNFDHELRYSLGRIGIKL